MRAVAVAAEGLIAAVPQQMAVLEASGTLALGSLEGADRTEFTAHRQCSKIEDCRTERGLTNKLHGAGRNPLRGIRGAHGGIRVAAIQPNYLTDPTRQIEVRKSMCVGSP